MRITPAFSTRGSPATHFAEVFFAAGPHAIGATGDNSYDVLFGRNWMLVVDVDDGYLHAYQEQSGGTWLEVTADLPPVFASPAPSGSRRWSFCFDQSARIIVAFEDAGTVKVTRWDAASGSYVQNISFAGADPCVVMDASWSYFVPDSDVLVFALSPDRRRLVARVQREVFAIEHELWDFGAPVILDRVTALPYKYQVLVSDASGVPLPSVLLSDLYPVGLALGVNVTAELASGELRQAAWDYYPPVAVEVGAELTGGALQQPVVIYQPPLPVGVTALLVAGALDETVVRYQPPLPVGVGAALAGGVLADIGVQHNPPLGLQVTAQLVGGALE